MVYGKDPDEAAALAQALALRVIADGLENGESILGLMYSCPLA
jgi:hypothetical protein